MAKFKAEFENSIPTYTLTFRGQEFSYSMLPSEFGTKSDKSCFSKQLSDAFTDLDEKELDNDIDVDMLSCFLYEEDELFKILDMLEALE